MNTRTENLKKYNFSLCGDDQYRKNFETVQNNKEEQEQKVFVVAECKPCHIKVSTHNGKCPKCGDPVET